jgi:hypothetical protein
MARRATLIQVRAQREDMDIHIPLVGILDWAWPEHLPFWHTPNGGKREQVRRQRADGSWYTFSPEAKKLKRMGTLSGVLDLQFLLPNGVSGFLELKRPGESLTDEQVDFIGRARALGCPCEVAYSVEEALDILRSWLAVFGLKLRVKAGALI